MSEGNPSDDRDPIERLAEEFIARLRRGEHPTIEGFAMRHPDLADSIRALLPAMVEIERLAIDQQQRVTRAADPTASGSEAPERTTVGPYRVVRELGHGGMGDVLLVRDENLRREIAVKLLHPDLGALEMHKLKFVSEAQATSQLDHPGIPPVHDLGVTPEGEVFFTMKAVRGRTLAEILTALAEDDAEATAEFTLHRLVSILERICEALHFAHEKGVIHRDLKPENVMLGAFGEVHVMDWGVAKTGVDQDEHDAAGDSALDTEETAAGLQTMEGTVKGTVPYMSPEQASGEVATLDRRSDVYALGCLLYEMLTLRPAFTSEGDTVMKLLVRVQNGEFEPVTTRNASRVVPPALGEVCTGAMAGDPNARPVSAAAFGAELRAWLDGRAERARRHAEAERLAAEGAEAAVEYRRLRSEIPPAEANAEMEKRKFQPWQSVAEKKSAIEAAKHVDKLRADVALAFADTTHALNAALMLEEANPTARAALADLWRERLVEAEAEGNRPDTVHAEAMARRYDDGALVRVLSGDGTLTLTSDPPGAEVLLSRFEEQDGVQTPVGGRRLGATPLGPVDLPMGSYLCVLRKEGFRDVRYPVHMTRNREWAGTLRMLTDGQIGADFVYVPGGPFIYGERKDCCEKELSDFAIHRYPVTFGEYVEFLAAVELQSGQEAAAEHLPRDRSGEYVERLDDGSYRTKAEIIDRTLGEQHERDHGEGWLSRLPVCCVSWHDAVAYCAWKSRATGREWRLPTEEERVKAARGVDGRCFPWGDLIDASLCKNVDSRAEPSQPEPVGAFPTSASVYGMGDAGGGIWDWTSSLLDPRRETSSVRAIRGGSWFSAIAHARAAARDGDQPGLRGGDIGFRPARSL